MRITEDWIREPALQALMAALAAGGHQAFLVGGCVRNALLGQPVADIDLATDATPSEVTALCEAAGLRVVPTGIDHGTVTVIAEGVAHEITTFRRDVETHGRHATVAFSRDIAEDAARRDFTINALYADASGRVIDPLGGLPDLMARRVRFVGDPVARIREDYLRILRFFRFTAWYATDGPDPAGMAACAAEAAGTETLSRERIGHEFRRLLDAPDPAPAVAAMAAAGVLAHVLPGADPSGLAPLVHLESGLDPDWLRRLAALGGQDVAERLRLSRSEARDLIALRNALAEAMGPAEAGYRLGPSRGRDAVLIGAALTGHALPGGWAEAVAQGAQVRFPVRAADLPADLRGAEIGARLDALERRWIASGFRLSREQLLA
ncbi:MAG: CCA tRNA nucleotidyltransferase [Pseudomonadota bacterium]